MTLSDYVSGYPAWNEIGRYQSLHPNNLVIRSDEVITYKGHTNNHASAKFVDYRTTPVYERLAGRLTEASERRTRPEGHLPRGAPRRRLDPDQPPADLPAHHAGRRGRVPRLLLGVLGRADRLLAARRARDRHRTRGTSAATPTRSPRWRSRSTSACSAWATRSPRWARATPTRRATRAARLEAPIGQATTVVRARELSETGIRCGVQARHTYVKVTGNARTRPALLGAAVGQDTVDRAIVGDVVHAWGAKFRARVLGGAGDTPARDQGRRDVETVPDRRRRLRARVPGRRQRALAHSRS